MGICRCRNARIIACDCWQGVELQCHIHCRESAIKRRAAEILHQQQQLAEELQRLHEEEEQLVEAPEKEAATKGAAKQDGPTQHADFQVPRDEAKAQACHSLALLMMGFRRSQYQASPMLAPGSLCHSSASGHFVLCKMLPDHHPWSNEATPQGDCSGCYAKPQDWLPCTAVVAFKLHPVVLCRTPLRFTQTSLSQCETFSGRLAGQVQGSLIRQGRPLMVTPPFQSPSEHFSGRLVWRAQCRWGRGGLPLR